MSISGDIAQVVHRLRRMPDIDIERLSYELDEAEWLEFLKELNASYAYTGDRDLSYLSSCMFMGMTVRKRVTQTVNAKLAE